MLNQRRARFTAIYERAEIRSAAARGCRRGSLRVCAFRPCSVLLGLHVPAGHRGRPVPAPVAVADQAGRGAGNSGQGPNTVGLRWLGIQSPNTLAEGMPGVRNRRPPSETVPRRVPVFARPANAAQIGADLFQVGEYVGWIIEVPES